MKPTNNNSLLDLGYAKTEESAELKRLWERMLQWKLPVAIVGTLVSFVSMGLLLLVTIDMLNSLEHLQTMFDDSDRFYRGRLAELWVAAALLLLAFILFSLFVGLFFSRKSANKYLSGTNLAKVLPAQTNYWRALFVGLMLGISGVALSIAFGFYYNFKQEERITEPVEFFNAAPAEEEVSPAEIFEVVPAEEVVASPAEEVVAPTEEEAPPPTISPKR